ncbi:MAG TPA: pyridoxal-dependent decarboxylase [Acidimicrobiales bacterium]|nr:pyridoxal-dependent decarboxylase [Acidimicrobiales bacterium]
MTPTNRIEADIAARALAYVLDPPSGDDLVVDFASPSALLDAFAACGGIELAGRVEPRDPAQLLEAVDLTIRHSVHTTHPRFLNQNFAGADPLAVVGDWLGAALNTTGATFEAAPVFTLMESAVLSKLGRMAGYAVSGADGALPPGLFCPGGSTATLYALQLARHRHDPDVVRRGAGPERLTVFVSAAGHYAARKSASLLGLGTEAVVEVETEADGAIVPAALEQAIIDSHQRGDVPLAVIATSGTTVTAAFDDLDALADICDRHDIWLHVDGCYGGSALFSPSQAHRLGGVERSDSFVWNLHKMMGMTQQCTALLVRDPSQLATCFATGADYLFQPDKEHAEFDTGDRTFQCARRVDVLKLWLTWIFRGDAEFATRIDHAVAMADHARHAVRSSDDEFVSVVEGDFTNLVLAWVPADLRPLDFDRMSQAVRDRMHGLPPMIKARMQAEGTAMVGFQPVRGVNTFRLIFMNPEVSTRDVDAVLSLIGEYGSAVDHS